jgi:hypothetical protein
MSVLAEDEFWRWLPPLVALNRLTAGGLPQKIALQAIINKISKGDIRIAAKRYETKISLNITDTRFAIIPPKEFAPSSIDAVFWELGDVKYQIQRKNKPWADTYDCTGIRLDPAGIEDIERQRTVAPRNALELGVPAAPGPIFKQLLDDYRTSRPGAPKIDAFIEGAPGLTVGQAAKYIADAAFEISPPRRPRANPMTVQEINTWHRGLSKAEKSLGVTALWRRARDDNPGRHIPRKLVEPFGKGRGTGHRRKA